MLRCPECRSRRATLVSMAAHVQAIGHKLCACSGYHYPHRPGSPYCESNPLAGLRHELRRVEGDEAVLDVLIEWALFGGDPTEVGGECPF